MTTIPLEPQYIKQKSFYNKAFIIDYGDKKTLSSYGTHIITITYDGLVTFFIEDIEKLSRTTLSHLRDFLYQQNVKDIYTFEKHHLINTLRNYENSNIRIRQ